MILSPATVNVIGIVLSLAGVLILFRYGMPYRVRTGGQQSLLLEGIDPEAQRLEKLYEVLGWIGLALILLGAAFQIVGAYTA